MDGVATWPKGARRLLIQAIEADRAQRAEEVKGTHKVDDPDPTPERGPRCNVSHEDGYVCTWRPGHAGPHVAGTGVTIAEVWT
jgi:hypothetical protein